MSERRRRKADRRWQRKAKRPQGTSRANRLRMLALARARAQGCTCAAKATLVELPIGLAVRIRHKRCCPRWEAIRPDGGLDVITGQLYPFVGLDDEERAA
jgi:hypothetical protein